MTTPLLDVQGLSINSGSERIVSDISFQVSPGEIVGVVGESGSGKTLTSLAISRLLPRGLTSQASTLQFDGVDVQSALEGDLRRLLGTKLAMVFQDPMSSLNPAMRIGPQLVEALRVHTGCSRAEAKVRAIQSLTDVQITEPEQRLRQYPHELSGGMRQRVMIAMGLMNNPSLIVADEPTTALDVTVQAQVMTLLRNLNRDQGTAVLLISHNIALVSEICDRVLVMYRGRLIDNLTIEDLLAGGGHPYARMLMGAIPDLSTDRNSPLVEVPELSFDGEGVSHA